MLYPQTLGRLRSTANAAPEAMTSQAKPRRHRKGGSKPNPAEFVFCLVAFGDVQDFCGLKVSGMKICALATRTPPDEVSPSTSTLTELQLGVGDRLYTKEKKQGLRFRV